MKITEGFKTYTEAFKESCAKFSEREAVLDNMGNYNYKELDRISEAVAEWILKKGVSKGDRAIAYIPRQKEIAAAAIGIWKAGCVYVPVDHSYPRERINYMMNNANAICVITIRKLWKKKPLDISEDRVIFIDEIHETGGEKKPKLPAISPEDDAMVIYTSGSTGKPKGVLHTHKSLFSLANWQPETETKATECSRYSNMTSFSFIASITDIYSVLLCGGSTFIINEETRQNPDSLYELLCRQDITNIHAPVRLAVILLENYDMRRFMVRMGGERVTEFKPLYPTTITEQYGSSEGCFAVYGKINGEENPMPLGKPNDCIEYMLVDEDGNEVETGEIGEFIYSGPIQAKQYLNLPELSEEKWFDKNGRRWFSTGDLMRADEDGTLYYVQRKDFMVKINGFRIELGEIENAALKCPGVEEAVCVARNINGGDHICCFFAEEKSFENNDEEIRKYMAETLPSYMMPSFIVHLDKLPRNPNGKLDRNSLPEIDVKKFTSETYVAPENELQQKLCMAFAKTLDMNEKDIGIDSSFFEMGGNSILVMKLLSDIDIPGINSMDIFKAKTVRALAEIVAGRSEEKAIDMDEVEKNARKELCSLTSFQSKIMADQLGKIDSTVWNIPILFRLDSKLDTQKLCQAVNDVIKRHPSLLTVIEKSTEGEMRQRYAPEKFIPIKVENISEEVFQKEKDDLVLPFAIFEEHLYRIRIIKTEENLYLFTDVHHLRLDGTSLGILYEEIVRAYRKEEVHSDDYYYSFLREEENKRNTEEYRQAERYFQDRYGKIDKWTRVPEKNFNDGSYSIDDSGILPCGLTVTDIEKAEERYNASRNVLAVAAALIALSEHTGRKNVMVSWIYNNRNERFYDNTVGSLNKELPVGICMDDIKSSEDLIEEIKRQVVEGISNSTYEYITEKYVPFTTDTIFVNYLGNLRNHSALDFFNAEQISIERKYDIAKVSLGVAVFELEDGTVLIGTEYCSGLYERDTAVNYHQLYQKAFVNLIKDSTENN